VQAAFCWFLLPILGAWLTIPELGGCCVKRRGMRCSRAFVLGAAYGIGGTAFGISIRYIGFSLTYAIAIGLSTVLGTLIPPLVERDAGRDAEQTGRGTWVIAGIAVGMPSASPSPGAGRADEGTST
jgi:L-rhamnose-H+ transport protein